MMMRAGLVALLLVVGACGLSVVGAEPRSSAIDAGTGESTTTPPNGDTTTTPDSGATTFAKSCKALLEGSPSLLGKDGVQMVDPDGNGANAPFQVWCDMTSDGGGWTLAGRSADKGTGDFGWSSKAGSPDDLTVPYSLDFVDSGITFEEILVRTDDHAYKLPVPADFDKLLTTKDIEATAGSTTVAGDCAPNVGFPQPGPRVFWNLGAISSTKTFFFRDIQNFDDGNPYGLQPSGWHSIGGDCPGAGQIDKQQGSVLIR